MRSMTTATDDNTAAANVTLGCKSSKLNIVRIVYVKESYHEEGISSSQGSIML